MYEIEITPEAKDDLRELKAHDRQIVVGEIESQLTHEPAQETRNKKRLRPNELAEWELRVGKYRVSYDVKEAVQVVKIIAVGQKEGSQLFVHGEEFDL